MHFSTYPKRSTLPKLALAATVLVGAWACNFARQGAAWADAPPSLPATAPAATQPADAFHFDLKETLTFLAADEQEGRGVATEGLNHAADRIADDFKNFGLAPLPGLDGYFQPFTMTLSVKPDAATSLSAGDKTYQLGADYTPVALSSEGPFAGDVVFVGYGISSKQYDYDDYADIDVKGKVVLALRFEPHNAAGTSAFAKDEWSTEAHLESKVRTAAAHGAAAIILVNPPSFHPADVLIPFSRGGGEKSPIPFLQVRQQVADAWLKGAGQKDLKTLQAVIDDARKPASFALDKTNVKGNVALKRDQRQVKNVVAIRPGKGDQYIVVGAHYDHLGYGGPGSLAPGVKAIHHGADDNASGTTAVLSLADHFAHAPAGDKTLVFIAFTGEEEGLVGSSYFVSHSPIDLNRVVAMVNLDMVGRVRNNLLYVGGQGTAPSLDAFVKEANVDSPLVLKSIGRGGLGPSDHMSFAVKKVPVLFLFSGMHIDYHRPSDTADKINYEGIEQVVAYTTRLIGGLQDMPREKYVDAADKDSMMGFGQAGSGGAGTGGGPRVSLGVIPDYSELESSTAGVKINGAMPDSGAAKAGLVAGDVIVDWNGAKLESLQQLQNFLDGAKAGDIVRLGVMRGGKRVDLQATLSERK